MAPAISEIVQGAAMKSTSITFRQAHLIHSDCPAGEQQGWQGGGPNSGGLRPFDGPRMPNQRV